MSDQIDAPSALINTWQQNLWRSHLNHITIPTQSYFQFVNLDNITREDGFVWVAPFVGKKESSNELWVPLWIPLEIKDSKLCLSPKHLPWMPPAQFEALLGQSPFASQMHCFDDWLRFEWLTQDNTLVFENWSDAFEACQSLLNELSENQWQERLSELGFSLSPQAIVFDEPMELVDSNALCNTFATIEDYQPKEQLSALECYAKASLLCGHSPDKLPLTASEFEAAVHVLSLEEGELLAVKAPIGSDKEKFISSIVLSKIIDSVIHPKSLSNIALLNNGELSTYRISLKTQSEDHKKIYAEYLAAVTMVSDLAQLQEKYLEADYEGEQAEEFITELQQQDEDYEKQLVQLMQVQAEFQKKIARPPLLAWFLPKKKLRAEDLKTFSKAIAQENINEQEELAKAIFDQIRQNKVQRTKIHQQLVDVVELSAAAKGATARWHQWLTENICGTMKNQSLAIQISAMQAHFGKQLFSWIVKDQGRWESAESIAPGSFLIVMNANRMLPQQVLPFLRQASQALFLGDNQDITALPAMSALPEEWELRGCALDDEEMIEQLQYKGLLPSTGNAFSVALANSAYQQFLDHGITANKLSLMSDEAPTLEYHAINVVSESEQKGNALINEAQAKFIADWLTTGPLNKSLAETAIITPFPSQKETIKDYLVTHHLQCEVMTFFELDHKQWTNVIFCPVYTSKDQRPFVFDQGDYLLYSLFIRATKNVWVIGDLSIFDPKMHSPSGNLAKVLFEKRDEILVMD